MHRRFHALLRAAAACLLVARPAALAAQPAEAQALVLRGIVALHNFEYEDANEAFRQAQTIDPGFVMASWGEAMTYNQTLWRHEDVQAARRVLARLGATPEARARKARTPTEKGFLAAVEVLFGDGSPAIRHRAYADAMGRLYAQHPDDPDVASFYALALLGTMSRSLIGYVDTAEGRSQGLAGSDTQKEVAAILEKVLASHPGHPGALHYLLHNDDDPEHARLALPAARTYASVAAESSHALHMPSHIFFQLGMWHDAASSDRAAFAASVAEARRKGLGRAMHDYHALAWLEYELLQLGRYREAWNTIGELAPVVKATGEVTLLSDLSSMRARYVIETRDWHLMATERNFGNANELFAIGVSAARSGNPALAEMARHALADRARAEQEGDLRPAIAIMEREVSALMALAAGRREEAVATLQSATRAELQLPAPFGLPEPVKPAPELLGEVLLEVGRPGEAADGFAQALQRNAKRSASLLGLARSEVALGRAESARQHYRELLANFDHADADRPELNEARAAVERASAPASRRPAGAAPFALAVAIAAAVAVAILARRLLARAPARSPDPLRSPRAERQRRRARCRG